MNLSWTKYLAQYFSKLYLNLLFKYTAITYFEAWAQEPQSKNSPKAISELVIVITIIIILLLYYYYYYYYYTFATQKNLKKWNLSQTSDCSFCFLPETLLHVFCWLQNISGTRPIHHPNSILNFLATSLKAVNESTIYADIPGSLSQSIITGENLRPDLLLKTNNNYLYILELTVGFESNLDTNATR